MLRLVLCRVLMYGVLRVWICIYKARRAGPPLNINFCFLILILYPSIESFCEDFLLYLSILANSCAVFDVLSLSIHSLPTASFIHPPFQTSFCQHVLLQGHRLYLCRLGPCSAHGRAVAEACRCPDHPVVRQLPGVERCRRQCPRRGQGQVPDQLQQPSQRRRCRPGHHQGGPQDGRSGRDRHRWLQRRHCRCRQEHRCRQGPPGRQDQEQGPQAPARGDGPADRRRPGQGQQYCQDCRRAEEARQQRQDRHRLGWLH